MRRPAIAMAMLGGFLAIISMIVLINSSPPKFLYHNVSESQKINITVLLDIIMQPSTVDAIIAAWKSETDVVRYSQIKRHLVNRKIIGEKNDRSLSRWLKKLVKEDYLEKTEDGYTLKMKPKAYQVFDYLNELRQKHEHYIYEGEVGGWLSHLCASTYLNFDETLMSEFDEKLAFDIISVRLGELFGALYLLKNDILKRRCGLTQLRLNDSVVRETLFGLLIRSIGGHRATEELAKAYSSHLGSIEKRSFDKLWKKNRPKYNPDRVDFLGEDFFFDKIEEDPDDYKQSLKKESSLDIDKYTVEGLIEKYVEINKWIQRNHKTELEKEHGYMLTPEESELESNYRTAILVKVAECTRALGTSTEDFAVILTRHPRTMSRYFTPEHILYEAMEWAREPPKEQVLKELWHEIRDEEKTFEGMVAARLCSFRHINPKTIESLRSRPWVKKELSKFGSFSEILRLYATKFKKRLSNDEKARREFLELTTTFSRNSKGKKLET